MSLNVSYSQNINKGIDSTALREVTQQIFNRAESKTLDLTALDLSKFKRVDLGMDLYSGKVDSSVAREVAMAKGMQVSLNETTLATIKFLNRKASEVALKNIDGKINPSVNEEAPKTKNVFQLPQFSQLVKTSDLNKDKNGSNPFYKGELLKIEKKEKEEVLNIFA